MNRILFGEIELYQWGWHFWFMSKADTDELWPFNSGEREILFLGHLWIGDIKIQTFPIVRFKMSGFEGIKNYNAQDDKIFFSYYFFLVLIY